MHKDNSIYNKEIKSISIMYYPTYNIGTIESLSEIGYDDFLEIKTIELKDNDLKNISNLISKIKKYSSYVNCNCELTSDSYLLINNEFIIYVGGDFGDYGNLYSNFDNVAKIPEELNKYVHNLMFDNNLKIFNKIDSDNIIIEKNNKSINVTDQNDKQLILNNFSYLELNMENFEKRKSYLEYDEISSIIDFDNGTKVYMYKNSKIGYLYNEVGESFYIITNSSILEGYSNFDSFISNIYDKYNN